MIPLSEVRSRTTPLITLSFIFALFVQIKWENRFRKKETFGKHGRFFAEKTCKVTVDGTDFAICEPKLTDERKRELLAAGKIKGNSRYFPRDSRYYSEKINHAALRYELAICIRTGDIVWVNGPYPASTHDLMIFRKRLRKKLAKGEMIEADDGYKCEEEPIRAACEYVSLTDKGAKGRARNRHEHVNGLLKDFGVLRQMYRHELDTHQYAMGACCTILQISFDIGQEPWQVQY